MPRDVTETASLYVFKSRQDENHMYVMQKEVLQHARDKVHELRDSIQLIRHKSWRNYPAILTHRHVWLQWDHVNKPGQMTQEQNVLKDLEWSVRNHTENRKENHQQTNKQKKEVNKLRSLFIRNTIVLERKPNSLFQCP